MNELRIAIIDTIGLVYDGTTLSKHGLGGSESAVILMSRELAKLGFDVTVFNNCLGSYAAPGIYDDVEYVDIDTNFPLKTHGVLGKNDLTQCQCDIVISSRSVYPFIDEKFAPLIGPNTYKVLWMHDTFCRGDEILENLVVQRKIDTVFTLSDWHTVYTGTCDHGHKRMFEVLKKHIFMTRNGAVKYKDVDIKQKDPNLFVYNASVSKGMIPLVTEIWPHIKRHIPEARLKVIGGYYRFRDNAEPDEQEKTWRELVSMPEFSRMNVDFTGIIKQSEVAEILSKASFMLYPSAFPETFGISSLESLLYNTPIVTCRFGALEETAIESACYLIDYPIEPNSLYPTVKKHVQIEQFVKTVVEAYRNPYLHQQKMYACNIVKEIAGWDTVALQWKQHFYKKLDQYLTKGEYRKVTKINSRVHEVFGRRFMNSEEYVTPRNHQRNIFVVTPMYNAEKYIGRCIDSVASQDYDNFYMVVIDDNSSDCSVDIVKEYIAKHDWLELVQNDTNNGALFNQINAISTYWNNFSDIIVLLDGDDSLINDNQIFHKINNIYQNRNIKMTYGSCWSMVDQIPLIAQPYPKEVFENKSFRSYRFPWNIPYTHLRTFEMRLLNGEAIEKCKDENGNFYKAGGDAALFYALIEQLERHQVKAVADILVNYNDLNPLNDYKINGEEQTKNANRILGESVNMTKSILIAVPTAKYVETATMKSIYDLEVPAGYRTELQFMFGYQLDQIRNLQADWGKRYDYLFCVDSDIVLPRDALTKLVSAQKDIISGVYIQRLPGNNPEIYRKDHSRYQYEELMSGGDRLVEIGSCGFGCVLINSNVLRKMEYPHFVYKSALDHNFTLSEDVYFCMKANEAGFSVWCDTSIRCDHIGQNVYSCPEVTTICSEHDKIMDNIKKVGSMDLLPQCHVDYLYKMKRQDMLYPVVIYDIGACVGHWGRHARECWQDAKIYAFEANGKLWGYLYDSKIYDDNYSVVLSDEEKEVEFYNNPYNLGGNSYYKENTNEYNESHIEHRKAFSLDQTIDSCNVPMLPDLIKIDIQGAELDVLKGAEKCLAHCKDVIVECQHTDYNEGAPKFEEVKSFLESKGFRLVSNFCRTDVDGDYHFTKFM